MSKLSEVREGKYYQVTWMIGQLAHEISEFMNLHENDVLYMDRNLGKEGVIVHCHGRKICMDTNSAAAIKVQPAVAWRVA